MEIEALLNNPFYLIIFIVVLTLLVIWETIWKGIGLFKSARNNHIVWFVCILIINSAGILPIIYLFFFQHKKRKG